MVLPERGPNARSAGSPATAGLSGSWSPANLFRRDQGGACGDHSRAPLGGGRHGILWGRPSNWAARGTGIIREDEVGDARHDFGAETRAVEHAVMADIGLQPVRLEVVGNVRAQPVRRFGLADAGNVVVLAFHGKE